MQPRLHANGVTSKHRVTSNGTMPRNELVERPPFRIVARLLIPAPGGDVVALCGEHVGPLGPCLLHAAVVASAAAQRNRCAAIADVLDGERVVYSVIAPEVTR